MQRFTFAVMRYFSFMTLMQYSWTQHGTFLHASKEAEEDKVLLGVCCDKLA